MQANAIDSKEKVHLDMEDDTMPIKNKKIAQNL